MLISPTPSNADEAEGENAAEAAEFHDHTDGDAENLPVESAKAQDPAGEGSGTDAEETPAAETSPEDDATPEGFGQGATQAAMSEDSTATPTDAGANETSDATDTAASTPSTHDAGEEMESDVMLPAVTSTEIVITDEGSSTPPELPPGTRETGTRQTREVAATGEPPAADPGQVSDNDDATDDEPMLQGVPELDTSTVTLPDGPDTVDTPESLLEDREQEGFTAEDVTLPKAHTLPRMGERTRRIETISEQASHAAQETQAAVHELKETAATLSSQVEKTDQLLQAVVHIAERVGGLSNQVATLNRNTGNIQSFLGKIGAQLQAFEAHLNKLTGFFNDRFKEDKVKERALGKLEDAFDLLHEEMRQYKDNFLQQAQKPVFTDLIHLYDDLGKMADATSDADAKSRFEFAREMVLEILYRRDIERFSIEAGKPFDSTVQKAIRREETDDPERDREVATVLRAGFRWGETIFRPEEVVVLRFSGAGDSPTDAVASPPTPEPPAEDDPPAAP